MTYLDNVAEILVREHDVKKFTVVETIGNTLYEHVYSKVGPQEDKFLYNYTGSNDVTDRNTPYDRWRKYNTRGPAGKKGKRK